MNLHCNFPEKRKVSSPWLAVSAGATELLQSPGKVRQPLIRLQLWHMLQNFLPRCPHPVVASCLQGLLLCHQLLRMHPVPLPPPKSAQALRIHQVPGSCSQKCLDSYLGDFSYLLSDLVSLTGRMGDQEWGSPPLQL